MSDINQTMHQALAHFQAGRLREAEALYRQVLSRQPNHADALHMLGVLAGEVGRFDLAVQLVGQAIAADPTQAIYHFNAGHFLCEANHPDAAIAPFQRAVELNPRMADAWFGLANAQRACGQMDAAIASYRRAIEVQPDFGEAMSNLAQALKDQGILNEAMALFERAMALYSPANAEGQAAHCAIHSNWLYTMLFHPGYDAAAILREHRKWDQRHAEPLRKFWKPHSNDRSPDRPLRIGYVSGDFHSHVIGRNVLPVIEHHDRSEFEVFCYSDVTRPDAITRRFQAAAAEWRAVQTLNDEQLANLVRQDRIDILVDLSLHMAGNRLMTFARKPAPIQVTFAGYPGTTGVSAIDYRLTDPHLDPPGKHDADYSEKSVRLPDSFWCYDPLGVDVPVTPLPAASTGQITFGCLNNFCKINAGVLALWAKVMNHTHNSRLLLLAPEGDHCRRTAEALSSLGVRPDRLHFLSPRPRERYLAIYQQIDIGLDTFPYNGHSTSLDALWMGVPVISLIGTTVVGRAGLSQLTNLGLPHLAASSEAEFLRIVAELTGDLTNLAELRASLRARMEASPLMDALKFTRGIEAAYRNMWREHTSRFVEASPRGM